MTNAPVDLTDPASSESPTQSGEPGRGLRWLLAVGGAIGFLAAFVLTVERYKLLVDPNYDPTCSINTVLSCGSVMTKPQAAIFGFPNPLLGIAGFAIVTTIGVVLLTGARLPRWFWLGLQGGVTAAAVLIHWLIYQSIYSIGALCPYCMVVWAVTVPMFWYVSLYNLRGTAVARSIGRYHAVVLAAWALFLTGIIVTRFAVGN
ncbi:putative membrane protein [Kribbella amoyensis]|uniref:Putative membrane protein n=1 Tax=Kribbella amoyensis TaxID=996641 RepID=A0A561B2X5_9ACTN|nr:vitamin K epoxide reductase family protein [Kribbella amoyensis]TWD73226.1 putative membrane protein [Kribbella amoyensis]